ncbi:MAG TPA: SDR family NAD(P)-dependent oxidoreductase [Polyangia bacterium]|jgi:NAD(P)-dependent dehydrogenase (short-subunit alcohol dehydrogenase family)|nr:SDR family NAD(P)-dependent oxidoreductase [Polyangia bacterium]
MAARSSALAPLSPAKEDTRPGVTTVLITGASSGIGLACARWLAERGYRVFGASRRPPPAGDAAGFEYVAMDVTDDASVAAAVAEVVARAGRIDVVVNNAGFGYAGAIEDTSIEEARAQLDANFLGVLRVLHQVLPHMRAAGGGRVINISSIGGLIGAPFQGMYSASKFALEGLTEVLRHEVRADHIHVSLVEPGDFNTGFTANRRIVRGAGEGSPYREQFARTLAVIERDEAQAPGPRAIARLVERIIRTRRPALRYPVGVLLQRLGVTLRRFLPAALFEAIVRLLYRVRSRRGRG